MTADVLAIPISTVASESTFSAGGRVIDPFRASLDSSTVQTLICGGDWLRVMHGIKKKPKITPIEVSLYGFGAEIMLSWLVEMWYLFEFL
ncbi:zinc finger BED domain-containing protein DAYSLEEPER [Trifolium repens]|nr:zinc finger BED domain-containing protein DAYSLEEPER [Trifolium repens]